MVYSTSRLRAWRNCQRLEQLERTWQPVVEADALAFGRAWHAQMDAWWRGQPPPPSGLADPFSDAKLRAMVAEYGHTWSREVYTIVGVEDSFAFPLDGQTFAGTIDKRVLDRDDRKLIVEHKTTSDAIDGGADYWLRLQMDDQISAYYVGAHVALDWSPDSLLYDVARKPAIRPLQVSARRKEAETPDEFYSRCREVIAADRGAYFGRLEIPRTELQLEEWLRDTRAQMRIMETIDHAPRNPDACYRRGRCPYLDVCSTGLDPAQAPDKYKRRMERYETLTAINLDLPF